VDIEGRGYTNITVSSNAAHVLDFSGGYVITKTSTISIVFTNSIGVSVTGAWLIASLNKISVSGAVAPTC
jgi:hypothetical protein